MSQYNIPKMSRNKYNVVKDNAANNVVTQTQLMNSFGAGNSSGGGIGITHNTFQQQAQVNSAVEKASYNLGLSTYSYVQSYFVAKDELQSAAYLTQSQLSTMSYVTQPQLSTMSYATTSFVSEKCAEVQANAYAYTESKIVDDNLTSYNQVKQMIEDVIAYMKSTGELISAAAVDQKISDSRV